VRLQYPHLPMSRIDAVTWNAGISGYDRNVLFESLILRLPEEACTACTSNKKSRNNADYFGRKYGRLRMHDTVSRNSICQRMLVAFVITL